MKTGLRTPSLKKSIKARTTGRAKRAVKSAVNPLYGKKGMGIINNPTKAIYNKVYNKTTVGVGDIVRTSVGQSSSSKVASNDSQFNPNQLNTNKIKKESVFKKKGFWAGFGIFNAVGVASMISTVNIGGIVLFAILVFMCWKKYNIIKNGKNETVQKLESDQADEKTNL